MLRFDFHHLRKSPLKLVTKAGRLMFYSRFTFVLQQLGGFGICVCCNHILLMNSWAMADFLICCYFYLFKRWGLRMGMIHASHSVPEQDSSTPTVHIAITFGIDIHGPQRILNIVWIRLNHTKLLQVLREVPDGLKVSFQSIAIIYRNSEIQWTDCHETFTIILDTLWGFL